MTTRVTRRSARAVLLDGRDLLLIKRTRPGEPPYWVTIGGGVEPGDSSLEDAVRREVLEEIGAQIQKVSQVFLIEDVVEDGIAIQHVFLAELAPEELVQPTGKELSIPSRGGYELVRVPFTTEGLAAIELKPAVLADFLSSTHDALAASLDFPVTRAATEGQNGGSDVADPAPESERA